MIEAYEKINKKKREKYAKDARLAKELKEIRLQRQYMNASQRSNGWRKGLKGAFKKKLESGAERQIRNNQNEKEKISRLAKT